MKRFYKRHPKARSKMRIAFVYYNLSSFVRRDCEILSRHFCAEKIRYKRPFDIVKIAASVWRSEVSFSWFASGHSFIAVLISKLLGRKSVVVAGGYDVAYAPEIGYGQYTQGWQKRMYADNALKHADLVLAVSEFTKEEVLARTKPKRIEVIYNAVDTDKFRPGGKKEDIVLTVATGGVDAIKLKGLDTFVKAASYLPEAKFIILGLSDESIKILESMRSSNNIEMQGYVDQEKLIGYYQKAKVYCQLSYRESFGVALAEAMACGCIPVATKRGALPEVVGDTGYYVPYGDPYATAVVIQKALSSNREEDARHRAESLFRKELRDSRLIYLIENLIKDD
jgi:glycosyltransferase involved in cell wall biosynthesis